MAKTQKYSEELLLGAVISYAEVTDAKIKASDLARWASTNVPGLEGVRDYHFTRPAKGAGQGKRPSTLRMEEINARRDTPTALKLNRLLFSSNIDEFFTLDHTCQRELILETRKTVEELKTANRNLTRQNEHTKKENERLTAQIQDQDVYKEEKLADLQNELGRLEKAIHLLCMRFGEEHCQKALEEMGILNGKNSLQAYVHSLKTAPKLSFEKTTKDYENTERHYSDFWEGIDFKGEDKDNDGK